MAEDVLVEADVTVVVSTAAKVAREEGWWGRGRG